MTIEGAMNDYSPDGLSKDVAYDLVAERLRREVVHLLLTEDGTWSVDALAAEITARENGVDPGDVNEETRKRAAVALLHRDFPKLASSGVITFDLTNETVARGENIDDLAPLV